MLLLSVRALYKPCSFSLSFFFSPNLPTAHGSCKSRLVSNRAAHTDFLSSSMRRVLRRFKDNGDKQDPSSSDDPIETAQKSLEMAPTTPSDASAAKNAFPTLSSSKSGTASTETAANISPPQSTGSRFSTTVDTFGLNSVAGSSRLTSELADFGRAGSLYSEASSLADESLFSKNTRSTAPSTLGSLGMTKRAAEERIRVMEAGALSETHDKTEVPISTSPVETRPREISSMGIPAMAPVTAPCSTTESIAGSYGQSSRGGGGPGFSSNSGEPARLEKDDANATFDTALASLAAQVDSLWETADLASGPRVAGIVAQILTDFTNSPTLENGRAQRELSNQNMTHVRSILRSSLGISDNLLRMLTVRSAKAHLHRALYRLGASLDLVETTIGTVPYPRNWALGTLETPDDETVCQLMDRLSSTTASIVEQEGAYVAPVLRGFSKRFAVASVVFGIPRGDETALAAVASLQQIVPCVHVYGRNDYLRTCAGGAGVTAPFRQLDNTREPPMSMSIATERAGTISGTLGGYLRPVIEDEDDDDGLGGYTFAITCGHVCLNATNSTASASLPSGEGERNALVPSPVLVQMFRRAICDERNKFEPGTLEYKGYQRAIDELDARPPTKIGPVVWGERTVVNGMLSDISIIKCDRDFVCDNKLGDDLTLSQYDPGLMFSNLAVNEVVSKVVPGMPVFKYGSTSRYTSGNTSAARIVYWSSGKIQSSEFVVNSDQAVFATGGDSGAWILTKARHGLGVLGMLHSYDGEMKEFGLYTPMDTILSRLEQVTSVPWRVVGVPDSKTNETPAVL